MKIARPIEVAIAASVAIIAGCSSSTTGPKPDTGVGLQLNATAASPGDTVLFAVTFAHGDTPGDALHLDLRFDGGPPAVDTTHIPPGDSTLRIGLILPTDLPDGTLTITVVLPTDRDSATAQLTVRAALKPVLNPNLGVIGGAPLFISYMPLGDVWLMAGGSDSVAIQATDSIDLTWIGWTLGPPANMGDSIQVSGRLATWQTPLVMPSALAGTAPELTEFARNAQGQRAELPLGPAAIGTYLNRPAVTATIDGSVGDVAYDAKRRVLYLATADQPSVSVIGVPGLTSQPVIPLPGHPISLDLTPGGDTLVVALAGTEDLALVNLAAPGHPTGVVRMSTFNATPGDTTTAVASILNVRVAADDRVIVLATSQVIADFDLTTGVDRLDFLGAYFATTLGRTGDASRVILPDVLANGGSVGDPTETQPAATFYDATAHGFIPATGSPPRTFYGGPVSADQHGTHYLIHGFLFDRTFATLGSISQASPQPQASTLSPTGPYAFESWCTNACSDAAPGYYVRVGFPAPADTIPGALVGQLLEVVNTPFFLRALVALPDGSTLIGLGTSTIAQFDLTQSSPAGFSRVTRAPSRGKTVSKVATTLTVPHPAPTAAVLPRLLWRPRLQSPPQ
jgi:hypothetical protein